MRDHVTETIRRHDEESLKRLAVNFLQVRVRDVWSFRLEFGKRGFHVINFEKATFLRWIAAVFGESYLNFVAREDGAFIRFVAF